MTEIEIRKKEQLQSEIEKMKKVIEERRDIIKHVIERGYDADYSYVYLTESLEELIKLKIEQLFSDVKKYEYTQLIGNFQCVEEMGNAGWELVTIQPSKSNEIQYIYVFKRLKQFKP
jgi:hypothetical protein